MIERIIIVAAFAILGIVLYRIYTRNQLLRIASGEGLDPILAGLDPNVPTIVYFTTPNCVPCKTRQQPAIEKVRNKQAIQVIQIDATEKPDVANRWGVMSAPTTFVLDTRLRPTAVNHGVADETLLSKQLNDATNIV